MGRIVGAILDQSYFQHFPDMIDEMEGDARNVFLFDFVDVFFILATENDLFDSGSFGGKNLFSDTTHGEDFATESDFSGHGKGFFHFPSG